MTLLGKFQNSSAKIRLVGEFIIDHSRLQKTQAPWRLMLWWYRTDMPSHPISSGVVIEEKEE
jgi:hypothetical protein